MAVEWGAYPKESYNGFKSGISAGTTFLEVLLGPVLAERRAYREAMRERLITRYSLHGRVPFYIRFLNS